MSNPEVMRNFQEDLGATVEGRFSPEDWEHIRLRAEGEWRRYLAAEVSAESQVGAEQRAWHKVVRDFHQSRYWGFNPNYRPPKVKRKRNLGLTLIWMTFTSMVAIKVVILWFGQIYARSDEPIDKWIFFVLLFLALANYGYFLWRYRDYKD